MKVLVTGAGGFIGYNLCTYLLEKGHEVVASYRSNIPHDINKVIEKYGDRITLSKGDLLDDSYYRQLEGKNIDSVVNAAVITSLAVSELEAFILMSKVNIQSTVNLLDFSIKNNIKNHVYVSSSGVYGSKCDLRNKVFEDGELDLFNTYCIAKRSSEMLVARYGYLTGTKGISARIAAPYGPYERVTSSRTAMSPIYKMIEFALEKRPMKIYGEKIVRDWTYVEDTVASIYELLICKKTNYTEYNVSNSVSYSLGDIARAMKEALPEFQYSFVDNVDGADIAMYPESQRWALDVTRISQDTGFVPKFALKNGIEKYAKWAIDNFVK
jgi:UDP-glucose 4-epimerase